MRPIIEVNHISKKYRINHHRGGYIALRDILTAAGRHPLKFLHTKARQVIGLDTKEDFWALKDVSFNVNEGDVIGIIGHNGAGKSTLLKILSRITPPTSGEIHMHGRVGSLLEVGTGFHPELTGRENVFLNGAILGMGRREIAKKFDAIVDFAGIEKFLDTPVKFYSSGMYVRLAFSVAAHMEPDILIIDEVLAVGDADFQKKCLGKMEEVTKKEGRTILFVSHNMGAIQALCNRTILFEHGSVKKIGETKPIIHDYLDSGTLTQTEETIKDRRDRKGRGHVRLTSFFVESNGEKIESLSSGQRYTFCFGYKSIDGKPISNLGAAFAIRNENDQPLALNWTRFTKQHFSNAPAQGIIRCEIRQKFPFNPGLYHISGNLFQDDEQEDHLRNLAVFEVKNGDFFGTGVIVPHSPINLEQHWTVSES